WREALGVAEGRGVGTVSRAAAARDATPLAARIRALIFDPLLPSLRGARHLIMVLDDVLQAVPIDALPAPDAVNGGASAMSASSGEDLLDDRYEIELRSTTQELLVRAAPASGESLVMLVGGADY